MMGASEIPQRGRDKGVGCAPMTEIGRKKNPTYKEDL